MGERISDSCVRPVVTFSVYLSPLPYTHGPYDHILSIKENHTGKNSKPIPATAAYLSYLLVRPSFASSDRNLLCPPIPSGPSGKYLLRRGPCECMVEAVSPLFPYEYSLHNKPLILKLYYLEFLVFSILKSLKNMN